MDKKLEIINEKYLKLFNNKYLDLENFKDIFNKFNGKSDELNIKPCEYSKENVVVLSSTFLKDIKLHKINALCDLLFSRLCSITDLIKGNIFIDSSEIQEAIFDWILMSKIYKDNKDIEVVLTHGDKYSSYILTTEKTKNLFKYMNGIHYIIDTFKPIKRILYIVYDNIEPVEFYVSDVNTESLYECQYKTQRNNDFLKIPYYLCNIDITLGYCSLFEKDLVLNSMTYFSSFEFPLIHTMSSYGNYKLDFHNSINKCSPLTGVLDFRGDVTKRLTRRSSKYITLPSKYKLHLVNKVFDVFEDLDQKKLYLMINTPIMKNYTDVIYNL